MLERLVIENYALIEKLDLNFSKGFTIITGETGAGKSIILDALGLLLGERIESKAIADKTKKTLIEAYFTSLPDFLKDIFESNGLEWDKNLTIVRREISPSGRSRAFINDTPVTLQVLSDITLNLIDIHSQHNNLMLMKSSNQLAIIDDFSGNRELLDEYKQLFSKYVELRQEISKIKNNLEKEKEKKEFISFRLEQLDKIKPKSGELEKIEKEFDLLSDAEQIKNDLGEAYSLLDEGENSVLSSVSSIESLIGNVDFSLFAEEEEENLYERIDAIKIELKDISETISSYIDKVEADPVRLSKLSSRMNLLYDTIKRFKVKDEDELVNLHEELKESLNSIETGDENLSKLEKEAKSLALEIKKQAEILTEKRKEGAEKFAQKLKEIALPLGLANIQLSVELNKGKITSEGQDRIQILCSFNKNQSLQPLASVASGGETSRLMLSIKSIMSGKREMPTIIFDEIDTGVSGEIADKMGVMMKNMAEDMQVIAITHLPQVAAKGVSHFKVYKKDDSEKTVSHVKELTAEERINEIASMLSGSKLNNAALENARVLIKGE